MHQGAPGWSGSSDFALVDADRLGAPLLEQPTGAVPIKATELKVEPCDKQHAVKLVRKWHSRLPTTQPGPWKVAFRAAHDGITYGVALWNNPSARTLPDDWLELRRMAVSDDAPPHTASRMLGEMRKWIKRNMPEVTHLISYQDKEVHKGTIYKAAGWHAEYESKPRVRDRSKPRAGTGRMYRWNINGQEPDAAGKVRWGIDP